ncbi:hypothetical protein [Geminicoccus roseus]|uniref:hypothetical protein n=1 Tax=Geminicoccus roseus TaxID=404900 RepID=UPI0004183DBE|nr:hypothetical protein [Geminicoccus roseus]
MAITTRTWGLSALAAVAAVALGVAALPGDAAGDDARRGYQGPGYKSPGHHGHGYRGFVDYARVHRGYAIAPVRLNLKNRDRTLVGLGSYIVNAQGGCNDCHTNPPFAPGGDPFKGQPAKINTAGYLAGGVAFGPIVSKNITPHKNGRPNGLTYKEFLSIMRTGHKPGEARIRQVMPWPVYGNMIEPDLRAVYEYLRAIPPIRPKSG